MISNFLRKHHTDFQSGCKTLHSCQKWMSDPLTLHPLQHKLSLMYLILFILTGECYLRVILMCISLMAKDGEHFLTCLLGICTSCFENSLFRSVPQFLIELFGNLMSCFLSSLYILEINLLFDVGLVKIFSHSVGYHFVLVTVSLALQKCLSFRKSHLLIVALSIYVIGVIFR